MNLLGGLKMIWNKITGKDVSPDVMAAESRIAEWRAIYAAHRSGSITGIRRFKGLQKRA